MQIRILGRANSFNVRKVLWTCDELGIAYTREDWGRGFKPTSQPEFLRINPLGLVPAVIDGDQVLRESNAIVRYLATKYGGEAIYPTDPLQRARIEQWMDWANYETSISLRGAFLGGVLNEPPWSNPLVRGARTQADHQRGRPARPAPGVLRSVRDRNRLHGWRHPHRPGGQQMVQLELRSAALPGGGSIL
jgi:glutathione S-transferase